jgi:hypothetical protein
VLFLAIFLAAAGYMFLYIGIKGQPRYVHAPWLMLVDEFKGVSLKPAPAAKPNTQSITKSQAEGKV